MEVKIEQAETKGAAYIEEGGNRIAEMTFSVASAELIIIDHTEVNEAYKGKSLGRELLNAIVDKARTENFKIMPLCPFANSVFKKDESIRDVLN
ncbi:MAG: N-acetyltransferase [Flavobacteriales bacterium]|nr:N-acetyltransferase [Flavobacteriales bacterium]